MATDKNNLSPQDSSSEPSPAPIYEIRVKGCMDRIFWSDWFGSLEYTFDLEQEETLLRGQIADQAELYGLLSRLRNRGLTLISVQQIHAATGNPAVDNSLKE